MIGSLKSSMVSSGLERDQMLIFKEEVVAIGISVTLLIFFLVALIILILQYIFDIVGPRHKNSNELPLVAYRNEITKFKLDQIIRSALKKRIKQYCSPIEDEKLLQYLQIKNEKRAYFIYCEQDISCDKEEKEN